MLIDLISDLHGHYPKLEGGDLLIVGGDLTARDEKIEYAQFADWYLSQPYKKRILIAGNHDTKIQNGDYYFNHDWLGYVQDYETEFEGLKIWGSPWTAWFEGINPHCTAFTKKTDDELAKKWAMIPPDIDILITHSPPYGILDTTKDGRHVGSESLREWVLGTRPNLRLHVFGHIHENGSLNIKIAGREFVNASHVNEKYRPVNKPVRVIL